MMSQYIIYSIIGAIIFPLMHYFSLNKKYKICALLPAIPLVGLTGLFFIIKNKGNINNYVLNHSRFLFTTLIMYIILTIVYYFTKKIYLSIFISFIIWFFLIIYNL